MSCCSKKTILLGMVVLALIGYGCESETTDTDEDAAHPVDVETVKDLLAKGVSVNSGQDADGNTLLHQASRQGRTAAVRLLLEKRADVNALNKYRMTPLHSAAIQGHLETAALLVSRGADMNAGNHRGWTPLFNAAMEGETQFVEFLLANRAKIDIQDDDGNMALHYACGNCRRTAVAALLAGGANINVKNRKGETPLDWVYQRHGAWAAPQGHDALAKMMRAQGAKRGNEIK